MTQRRSRKLGTIAARVKGLSLRELQLMQMAIARNARDIAKLKHNDAVQKSIIDRLRARVERLDDE